MDRAGVYASIEGLLAVMDQSRDRDALLAAGPCLRRLRAWLDAVEVHIAAGWAALDAFPEHALAGTTRTSLRDALRVNDRAGVLDQAPAFAHAMTAGEVSGRHVDELDRALRRLEPAQQRALLADQDRLATIAGRETPDQFRHLLNREITRHRLGDGLERIAAQRRDQRLDAKVLGNGMWCFTLTIDPVTGLKLSQRLTDTVQRLAGRDHAHAPSDPRQRALWLRAQAMLTLTDSGSGPVGPPELITVRDERTPNPEPPPGTARAASARRPELVAVKDERTLGADGRPVIDWGTDHHATIPDTLWDRLAPTAHQHLVRITDHGITADGTLNLGDTTRLANRAQRRVLRALYPTCAIPRCATRYAHTEIHHITWWEHGGPTNLANLLPLCAHHHHRIHTEHWQLTLAPDRTLTITHPNGTTMTTGPPPAPPPRPGRSLGSNTATTPVRPVAPTPGTEHARLIPYRSPTGETVAPRRRQ